MGINENSGKPTNGDNPDGIMDNSEQDSECLFENLSKTLPQHLQNLADRDRKIRKLENRVTRLETLMQAHDINLTDC